MINKIKKHNVHTKQFYEINHLMLSKCKELTNREKKVLEYAAKGMSNKEIGEKLYISNHTVKAHVHDALHKLSASNKVEAVYKALKSNLID